MKDGPRSRLLAGIEEITDPKARSEAFPGLLKVWRSMESDERRRVWAMLPNDENRPKELTVFAPVWRDLDEPWQDEVLHGALSPVLTPHERTEALTDLAPHMADSSLERQMLWAQGVARLVPPDNADPHASIRREAPWMREEVMFRADLSRLQPGTRQYLLRHAVPGTANDHLLRERLQQPGASS
jgi:hypothetical protein